MRRLLGPVLALLLSLPVLAADITLAVDKAELRPDPFSGQPTVMITLTPDGRKDFAKLTLKHLGQVIELRVAGELLTAPVVQSPILDGVIIVSGAMTQDDARRLAERIGGEAGEIVLTPVEHE
ncbi:hypothetical protein [Devosia ginsengisoli]|uniref:SecDF P1 head subdomain-containing protein n=1 Tax=Devosia ginsengisoli TaxID=400770 RepID=UPI0026EBD40E|nr:hypothetical protein [Devosia ginsengisoli]MCR6671800.1 hypothetical protein [Devosia ginsengisoli]